MFLPTPKAVRLVQGRKAPAAEFRRLLQDTVRSAQSLWHMMPLFEGMQTMQYLDIAGGNQDGAIEA